MLIKTLGLVLKEREFGENDKYLTVLSEEYGKMTVLCKGVRSFRNKNSNFAQMLCYDEFVLYRTGSGGYMLKEASPVSDFRRLRDDIQRYSLSMYFCELAAEACVEGEENRAILSLLLNSLYLLDSGGRPEEQIKAVFEMRLASLSGFMPDLSACAGCGCALCAGGEYAYLDVMDGVLRCGDCFRGVEDVYKKQLDAEEGKSRIIIPVSPSVLAALRHIVFSDPKRIFSFSLEKNELADLGSLCEKYLLNQFDEGFNTLDFYYQVKRLASSTAGE